MFQTPLPAPPLLDSGGAGTADVAVDVVRGHRPATTPDPGTRGPSPGDTLGTAGSSGCSHRSVPCANYMSMEHLPQRESVSQIGVFHTPRLCNVAPNSIGGPQGRIRRGRTRRESQLADRTAPLSRVKSAWNEATEKLGASCRIGVRGMRAGIGHALCARSIAIHNFLAFAAPRPAASINVVFRSRSANDRDYNDDGNCDG